MRLRRATRQQANASASRVTNELSTRLKSISELKKALFEPQLQFILDPAKLKTAQCTRRAGKTYSAGVYLVHDCLWYPRSTCLYLATTREQARRILIKDIMIPLNRKYKLGIVYNRTDLSLTFPNESVIYLLGLDSNEEEMEKAYGQKYRLVVIDEAGMWRQDQRELVHSVLEPAMADLDGTIALIGSPVPSTRTYFYDITGRDNATDPSFVPGWSRHYWGWWDNPYTKHKIEALLEKKLQESPGFIDTTFYKNMYLNKWVSDTGKLVYQFDHNRNLSSSTLQYVDYDYYLGVDLGYNDATSFVVWAHSPEDPNMYVVYAYKKEKLDITAVADRIKELRMRWDFVRMAVDGASKQAVVELRERHGLPLEAADKQNKQDFIEIMNSDFIQGRLKVVDGAAECLLSEYSELTWFTPRGSVRRLENPNCQNHACDAALYGWRLVHKYVGRQVEEVETNVDKEMDQYWVKEAIDAQRRQEEGSWARDFGDIRGGFSKLISRLVR